MIIILSIMDATNLPPHYRSGADIICAAPGFDKIQLINITESQFISAFERAWMSLTFFDPDNLVTVSNATVSQSQAIEAKQMLASFLIQAFPEPKDGRLVSEPHFYRALIGPAYQFACNVSDNVERVGRLLASMLGIDVPTGIRIAEGQPQLLDAIAKANAGINY